MQQWRFNLVEEIDGALLAEYVDEAIVNQRAGKILTPVRNTTISIPAELSSVLDQNNDLRQAFDRLTLGKQREYALYVAEAKRSTTKLSRLQKVTPKILVGVGLHDQYRQC